MKIAIDKEDIVERELECECGGLHSDIYLNPWFGSEVLNYIEKDIVTQLDVKDIELVLWEGIVKENPWMQDMERVFIYDNLIKKLDNEKLLICFVPVNGFAERNLAVDKMFSYIMTPVAKGEDVLIFDFERCFY